MMSNKIKTGIDDVMSVRNNVPEQYRKFTDPSFKKRFDKLSKAKGREIEDYIKMLYK